MFMGAERSAAFPFPDAHGAALQPTLHPCSAGEKKPELRPLPLQQVPAACQCWGGRIRPWGASFSVLLIPTDSASDANNSLTLINGDVYTRGSVKGWHQSNAWLAAGLREAGVLPFFPCSGAESRWCLCSPRLHTAGLQTYSPNPSIPIPGPESSLLHPLSCPS